MDTIHQKMNCNLHSIGYHLPNMSTLGENMKEEFVLLAVRQDLSICDLDLWLQGHSSDLKPLL